MTLLNRIKRIFNKNYRLIDTQNRIYENKQYTPEKDKFFEFARKAQQKYGLTQKQAVDMTHDAFRVKENYDNIADSKDDYQKVKTIEQIYDDWQDDGYYDEFYDYITYLYDEYE